jgi:hypothetical protein
MYIVRKMIERSSKLVILTILLVILSILFGLEIEAKPRYSSATTSSFSQQQNTGGGSSSSQDDKQANTAASGSSSNNAGIKQGEKDLLEDMLRESDVLNLLEQEQKKHERRLKELQNRLERELQQVQEHFETVMIKLKKTEEQLENNLRNVEKTLIQQVQKTHEKSENASSSWRWPFFILFILLVGLGGFFGSLYRNATKGMRML